MAKHLKFTNAVLCEHAVQGANNKPTLINVFAGDIIVAELPTILTFGLFIEMSRGSPSHMRVEFQNNGQPFAALVTDFPETRKHDIGTLLVPLIQAKIEKEMTLSIVGSAEGFAETTFLKKRISKGDIVSTFPTASEPPSEQSRPDAPAS